jgi:glycosyltransferase involved in cell wall biosynthesis/ADP-heptose:LPS heptosyltransferase
MKKTLTDIQILLIDLFGRRKLKRLEKNPTGSPERIIIHHLGKSGEGLLSLPMAVALREAYPGAHIEWRVLDRYRAFLGKNPFVDEITEIDSSKAKSLKEVGAIISAYHRKTTTEWPVTKISDDLWQCHAYCNYVIKKDAYGERTVHEIPFYKQFFLNLPMDGKEWFAPNWFGRAKDVEEGEEFLKRHGVRWDEKVAVVSPFVSDKTVELASDMTTSDWELVMTRLKERLKLPIIVTGTEFDKHLLPAGIISGYAPGLSLGALFYILQTRAHLAVTGNTGIGFAALFLKSNLLMYDNRKTWAEHTASYDNPDLRAEGDLWPMFDVSRMTDDMPDWESKGLHRRWKKEDLESDIAAFPTAEAPSIRIISRNEYPVELESFAKKLLSTRGHKYQKLAAKTPSCRVSVFLSLYNEKDNLAPRVANKLYQTLLPEAPACRVSALVNLFGENEWTIKRIYNLLNQTEKNIEVIVVDAGSPENYSDAILKEFGEDPRLTMIRLDRAVGATTAYNLALVFSRGKFIVTAETPELWSPFALRVMADWLDMHPDNDMLVAGSVNAGTALRWPPGEKDKATDALDPAGPSIWRRALHAEYGLFDEAQKMTGAKEWLLRLHLAERKVAISETPMAARLDLSSRLSFTAKSRRLQETKAVGWPYFSKAIKDFAGKVEIKSPELPGLVPMKHNPKSGLLSDDLSGFRDLHSGKRCFVMGNGPSLNKMDLAKLEGETVFACNGIFLLFDRIKWRPKYYTCVDSRVLPDRRAEIIKMHEENPGMKLFFPRTLHVHDESKREFDTLEFIPRAENRFYFNHTNISLANLPWSAFSIDADDHVTMPHTVSITMLQLALYMGFKDIYLIGCDTAYSVPATVKQEGPEYGDYGKLFFTSTRDDDPNHFDPKYFGAGKEWHNPKVGEMVRHYGWAKSAIHACGSTVYNSTVGGNLEVFPRVDFDSLFKDKK